MKELKGVTPGTVIKINSEEELNTVLEVAGVNKESKNRLFSQFEYGDCVRLLNGFNWIYINRAPAINPERNYLSAGFNVISFEEFMSLNCEKNSIDILKETSVTIPLRTILDGIRDFEFSLNPSEDPAEQLINHFAKQWNNYAQQPQLTIEHINTLSDENNALKAKLETLEKEFKLWKDLHNNQ